MVTTTLEIIIVSTHFSTGIDGIVGIHIVPCALWSTTNTNGLDRELVSTTPNPDTENLASR
jgi:hypothetical protein